MNMNGLPVLGSSDVLCIQLDVVPEYEALLRPRPLRCGHKAQGCGTLGSGTETQQM